MGQARQRTPSSVICDGHKPPPISLLTCMVPAKWLNGRSQPCCAPAFPSNTSRNFHHRDDCVGPIANGFSAICKASIALCLGSDRMVLSWTDLVIQCRTLVVCQDKASRIGRKPSRMANFNERPQRRSDSCQNTQSFCVSERERVDCDGRGCGRARRSTS